LLALARLAVAWQRMPSSLLARIDRMAAHLEDWLEEPEQPALLHGDLWSANVLAVGDRITGFLDPAIYFGHPEIELAYMRLFHSFGDPFFQHYAALRPISPGFFELRVHIYNLYPLLSHVCHFGGSYVQSVAQTLDWLGF
jgi:fructosamine-3-kinase